MAQEGELIWRLGTLSPAQSGYLQFRAQVSPTAKEGLVLVSAATAFSESDAGQQFTQASAITTVTEKPHLRLSVISSPGQVKPNELATFVITVSNESAAQASNVQIRAVVPDHVSSFIGYSVGGWCGNLLNNCNAGGLITWNLDGIEPGGTRTVLLPARVPGFDVRPFFDDPDPTSDRGLIQLTATASANDIKGDQSVSHVIVAAASRLNLTLTTTEGSVETGGSLTYTASFVNRSSAPVDRAVLRISLPLKATLARPARGASLNEGELVWQLGTLGAGQSDQRDFVISVADMREGEPLTNTALIGIENSAPEARATSVVLGRVRKGVRLNITSQPAIVLPGQAVTYTLTATNLSETSAADGVQISAILPDYSGLFIGLSVGAVCVTGYNYRDICNAGMTIVRDIGKLEPGASATFVLPLGIPGPAHPFFGPVPDRSSSAAELLMTGLVTWDGGSSDVLTHNLVLTSDLKLALGLAADVGNVPRGGTVNYTVAFINRSGTSLHDTEIHVSLPANGRLSRRTGGGVESDGELVWQLNTLGVGASGFLQFSVQIPQDAGENLTLVTSAYAQVGAAEASGRATVLSTITNRPSLRVVVRADPNPVKPGNLVTFAVTVTNESSGRAQNAQIRSAVPANVSSFLGYSLGAWCGNLLDNCNVGSPVSWSIGTLEPGASRTVLIPAHASIPHPFFSDPDPTIDWGLIQLSVSALADGIVSDHVLYNVIFTKN